VADLKDLARGVLARAGLTVERIPDAGRLGRTHPDVEAEFASLYARSAPFTMTSVERMYALWQAVRHVAHVGLPGDVVECGVWRGGSSMLAALALEQAGDRDRTLWLYDTFEGMSEPDERDVEVTGARMVDEWDAHRGRADDPVFAFGALDEVRRNMASTGHAPERVRFVPGKVEDTIPADAPERIALLRLDTDWYASTRHELEHLYPRLVPGGVLIVDDYGHWAGARQAVDEFFAGLRDPPLLTRIDYTGRLGVRP
jgi:predicted O-methyltransferase YrrM